jgi:hypothetical protein
MAIVQLLKTVWDFLYSQRAEATWGLIWALAIWFIFDLLRLGSYMRGFPRHVRNRLAERSISRLRSRITELERYRQALTLYLSSDRAFYLHALGILFGILPFGCMAGAMMILVSLGFPPGQSVVPFEILALCILVIAIVVGIYGLRLASWDTRAKISEVAAKVDAEIAAMKEMLAARTAHNL